MPSYDPDEVHGPVKERYAEIARSRGQAACCEQGVESTRSCALGYAAEELATLPTGADMGLGSGHPVACADLQRGETVLDLGSGGGIDCLFAAEKVGPHGRVIGVDMTEEMVDAARCHAAEAGHQNITIHHGRIESPPVEDASVDVVISNCVLNLSPDQPAVWRSVFRVLRPGGRVAISDIVATAPIPTALKERHDLLCGCVSGAAQRDDLRRWLAGIGFEAVRLEPREASGRPISQWLPDDTSGAHVIPTMIHARKPAESPTAAFILETPLTRSQAMPRIEVFDPPMCCDSGVCGPEPDEQLSRFSADLDWLTQRGVEARRYNLMHEPAAFTANEYVKRIVDTTEGDGLPVVLLDGQVISEGEYPTRQHLAEVVGLSMPDAAHDAAHAGAARENPAPDNATSDTTANDSADASPIFDERIAELVAIGAAIAANCEPCLKYHHRKAAELGVADEDTIQAVNVALRVKEQPAKMMVQQAQRLLVPEAAEAAGGCCGGSGTSGCC